MVKEEGAAFGPAETRTLHSASKMQDATTERDNAGMGNTADLIIAELIQRDGGRRRTITIIDSAYRKFILEFLACIR